MYYNVAENHNEVRGIQNQKGQKFFFPQSAILYSLLSYSNDINCFIEWDINECLSYVEKPGNWLALSLNEYESTNSNLTSNVFSYLNYDILFFSSESKVKTLS